MGNKNLGHLMYLPTHHTIGSEAWVYHNFDVMRHHVVVQIRVIRQGHSFGACAAGCIGGGRHLHRLVVRCKRNLQATGHEVSHRLIRPTTCGTLQEENTLEATENPPTSAAPTFNICARGISATLSNRVRLTICYIAMLHLQTLTS
jgi:hypothetical protein